MRTPVSLTRTASRALWRARGVWGDKFPPRRPRVSGARKRLLHTLRETREGLRAKCVASYSKARFAETRNTA